MGNGEREQSYWNLPRGSQLAIAGPGVVQLRCYSYRMRTMEGLFFSFLFFLSLCCFFVHTYFLPLFTDLSSWQTVGCLLFMPVAALSDLFSPAASFV